MTAKDFFFGLPDKVTPEMIKEVDTLFHFDISGNNGGQFTVEVVNGNVTVSEGLKGEATCLVETEDTVYQDVELGRANPQEAFMSGKIKVSDIGAMMKFGGLFKKL